VTQSDVDRAIADLQKQVGELQVALDKAIAEQESAQRKAIDEILKSDAVKRLLLEAVRQPMAALAPVIERGFRIQRELLDEIRPKIRELGDDEAAMERLKDEFVDELRTRLADHRGYP
jgi:hypothetical protein